MQGIADYIFLRSLGEGSHGAFYLATPPARLRVSTDIVGVKVLFGASNEDSLRRATRELRAFASARSPYLVTLLDAGRQDDTFFYAMEYCPGGSLAAPASPLSRSQVRTALAQAARGAHALHEVGLVHRSIKPANVLLHGEGARLADLGLVQALVPTQTMTGMGSIGAVEYVDPTLLTGRPATVATDIWSMGMTLHRCLSGVGAYGDMPMNDPLLCVRKVLGGRPVLSQDLSAAEASLITRCLAPNADDRPPDALALSRDLEALG